MSISTILSLMLLANMDVDSTGIQVMGESSDEIRSRTMENQRTDLLIRCYAMNRVNELGLPVSEAI